jgi:YidC/Oxa1 family membrane protein insertase
MNFDKRTILAFILIGAILVFANTAFYQKLVDPKGYELKQQRKQLALQQQAIPQPLPAEENYKTSESSKGRPVGEPAAESNESKANSIVVQSDTLQEKIITVETKLYKASLTSKGADVLQWQLLNYLSPNGTAVELFPENAYGTLGVSFCTKQQEDTLHTEALIFDYQGMKNIKLNGDQVSISFRLFLGENRYLEKIYTFNDGSYDIDLKVVLNNLDNIIAEKRYFISAPNGMAHTEKNLRDDMMYSKAGTAAAGVVDKGFKANNRLNTVNAELDWAGVRTKYFAFYLLPVNVKSQYVEILGREIPVGNNPKDRWKKFSLRMAVPFLGGKNTIDNFKIYLGPLEYGTLKSYNKDMQDFMDLGWKILKPFSLGILFSFKWMHNFIPNYGIVLLIFSVLIKVITYPLTHKSNQSMKKMQTIQPKLKELQEKYRSEPQKLNQMTMKLYKEEGVNPMGGCLPMLLQMPLLFALFIVFRTTIELRGQGFFWWIKDLSAPDTIYTFPGSFAIPMYGNTVNILPIIMGVTMYIQQKMTVTDPKQKMMIYFMPIFFTLLFNSFPSGLNMYYALFNILSIVQQKYLTPQVVPATQTVSPIKKRKS